MQEKTQQARECERCERYIATLIQSIGKHVEILMYSYATHRSIALSVSSLISPSGGGPGPSPGIGTTQRSWRLRHIFVGPGRVAEAGSGALRTRNQAELPGYGSAFRIRSIIHRPLLIPSFLRTKISIPLHCDNLLYFKKYTERYMHHTANHDGPASNPPRRRKAADLLRRSRFTPVSVCSTCIVPHE